MNKLIYYFICQWSKDLNERNAIRTNDRKSNSDSKKDYEREWELCSFFFIHLWNSPFENYSSGRMISHTVCIKKYLFFFWKWNEHSIEIFFSEQTELFTNLLNVKTKYIYIQIIPFAYFIFPLGHHWLNKWLPFMMA